MKLFKLITAAILCLIAQAVIAQTTFTQDKAGIIVTPDQPHFTIKLKSNPTTGYSWFLREFHPYFLEPVSHQFLQGDKKLIGASGFEIWTFNVKPAAFIVPQQTVIRFVYARPWEGQGQVQQVTFRVSSAIAHVDSSK